MFLLIFLACAAVHPPPKAGVLAPCPSSPNCVSTQAPADDAQHHFAPVVFAGTLDEVAKAVTEDLGCELVHPGPEHLLATCKTNTGIFTDDLHVLLKDGQLHLRSASRVGYGDLGVNRRRAERLVAALTGG